MNIFFIVVRVILVLLAIYYVYIRNFKILITVVTVLILTFLLWFIESIFDIKIDPLGHVLYLIILVMGVYLGEGLKFYDKYFWWDRVIHFFAGIAFVSFGIALANTIESLGNLATLFFCLTLAAFLHVTWEIAEYVTDLIKGSNHQRWQKQKSKETNRLKITKKPANQPAGLIDTMSDTMICMSSATITCIVWWFIL